MAGGARRTLRTAGTVMAIAGGLTGGALAAVCRGADPAASAAGGAPAEAPARLIHLRELPLLFADDSGVASRTGVVRTVHAATTRAAPVLVADRPWEGARVYVYGSVYPDDATGGLRLWYMGRAGNTKQGDHVLYATSPDGVNWCKPALGAGSNNIVFNLHSPSVLLDTREPDPARRYKMLGSAAGNYHAAYSADGLHWSRYAHNPVLTSSDTITLAQDPATGEYLAFHKRPAKIRGYSRRVVWLARSRDFQAWTAPELVFAPDEEDDAWARAPGQRMEVYNLSVYAHAAGFIGLATMFRVTRRIPPAELTPGQSPDDGPIDVQLATSADARTWQRTEPRLDVIPRGAPGTFDGGAILGVSSTCVDSGDETWVYYTALTTTHGGPIPPKRLSIGRAAWRRHGFVSLDAAADGGRIATKLVQLSTPALVVNADARRGQLRVTLLEADGRPIAASGILRADDTRWRAFVNAPTNRPVCVVVELTNARLFSLGCESAP